jgi:hypothetical protein
MGECVGQEITPRHSPAPRVVLTHIQKITKTAIFHDAKAILKAVDF